MIQRKPPRDILGLLTRPVPRVIEINVPQMVFWITRDNTYVSNNEHERVVLLPKDVSQ